MQNSKQYEPPAVTVVGDVKSLTAGKVSPKGATDRDYPAGTPKSAFRYYTK